VTEKCESDEVRIATGPEPLWSEPIGKSALAQPLENRLCGGQRAGPCLANAEGESIALEVARLDLVPVALRREDAQPGQLQALDAGWIDVLHAERLAGHGAGVLQSGASHGPLGNAQVRSEPAHSLTGRDSDLLDPGIGVVTDAQCRVQRNLLHEEVLGAGTDDPSGSGEVGGQER